MSVTGNKRGFTLIEVMISVTILAIGMVGIIRAYAVMINTLEVSDYSIETICVLKERMFEMQRESIEEDNLASGTKTGKIIGEHGDYRWQYLIKQLDTNLEYDEETGESNLHKGDLMIYLNEAKVTVSNEDVTPVRRFSLVTYLDGWGHYDPEE